MSSYFSNLLTNTTSRYNSLRRDLLSSEADGDTEDDSHISRVLRTYYTEKGRPFPPWLPPDPKAPQAAPAVFVSSAAGGRPGAPPVGRGGGSLSDLWDGPSQPQQQQQEPLSLRRAQGRGGGGRFQGRQGAGDAYQESQVQSRPLPSQRAGSYQSASSFRPAEPSPPPSAGSGSAQERLKARLWGSGRSTSPAQSASSSQNASPAITPVPSRSPFDRGGSGQGNRPSYPEERSSGGGYGGGGGGGGRQQNPYGVSANAPWAGSDDPYAPPASGYGSGGQQRSGGGGRVGLPSGPRMR